VGQRFNVGGLRDGALTSQGNFELDHTHPHSSMLITNCVFVSAACYKLHVKRSTISKYCIDIIYKQLT